MALRTLRGSKGPKNPKQTSDNLFSTDVVEVLLGISEGPIKGLKKGAKSYLIGDTPLQGDDGENNFENFELVNYKGSEAGQDINSRLGGFGASTTVNTELATDTYVVRQGLHTQIDYLDVRFAVNQLVKSTSKGTFEHTGKFKIEYKAVSSTAWTPVKTPANNPLPPQITADGFDIFYGEDTNNEAVNASPGDRPTFIAATQPISTGSAAVWFNSSNNFQPKMFDSKSWAFPTGLAFANGVWTWKEKSSWGKDKSTRAIVGASPKGKTYEQGDYWINTITNVAYFYNGSTWIIAGSSLRPGTFGENGTGGNVTVTAGEIAITGKTTSPFAKEFRIPVERINEPYMIRVVKTSPLNTTERFFDIVWESFQEVTADAYNFPGLATTQLVARASEQFSSIPDFSGIYEGRIVRVPSNYNAETRVYTGVWDGTWKLAYTNNPAYVANDIVMNDRYGMNAYYPITLNKYDVYEAGVWCDVRTEDGQPRFTYNGLISDPRGGRDAVNYLCGIFGGRFFDDGNGSGVIKLDRDDAYAAVFGPENVVDGVLTYSFTEVSSRHNDITVSFTNPDLNWQEDRRRVADEAHIAKYGRIPLNFIAVGCTNEKEALVRARYKLITGITEKMMVNFKTNRLGYYLTPYDVVLISDEDMGLGISGRVQSVVGNRSLKLRDPVFLEPGFSYKISFQLVSAAGDFVVESRNISASQTGNISQLAVTTDLPVLPDDAVFTIEQASGAAAPMAFRILSITEVDGDPDNVEIQAVQLNRGKWLFVDGKFDTIEDLTKYQLESKAKPKPPTDLRIKPTTRKSGSRTIYSLLLDWAASPTKTVSKYRISGSRDNGPESTLAETATTQFEWLDVPAGEYVFRVTAVDVNGYESNASVIEHRLVGDARVIDGIDTLRMIDEPSANRFESRSPLFQWGQNKSPDHDQYRVRVKRTNGDIIRTEMVDETYYTYEYTNNESDGNGTPRRSFIIGVSSMDQYGFLSEEVELSVSNPAPAAPTSANVKLNFGAAVVTTEVPAVRDFRGLVIHASTTQGFTPSLSNRVYQGPQNNVSLTLDRGQTHYLRVAFYDVFDDGSLNFSNELSVTIPAGANEDGDPPAKPRNLRVEAGVGFLVGRWDNASDSDLYAVELFYSLTNDIQTAQFGVSSPSNNGIIPGLKHGKPYFVWARSVDDAGNRSEFTDPVTQSVIYIDGEAIMNEVINSQKLVANAVTAAKLAANAVTNEKLAELSVSAVKLQNSIIDVTKIVDGAVATAKLAANAVTADQLAALAVNSTKLADNAATVAKIAANAVAAGKIAANAVTDVQLAALAVNSTKLAESSVSTGKIVANAVTVAQLAANAVTADQLANSVVNAAKMTANAVTNREMAANAVAAAQLAANAVTGPAIAANAITAREIAANSITAVNILAGSIGTNELAANSITAKHLVLTDGTNVFGDYDFYAQDNFTGNLDKTAFANSASPLTGRYEMRLQPVAADETLTVYSAWFPVEPNGEYYAEVAIRTATAIGDVRLQWGNLAADGSIAALAGAPTVHSSTNNGNMIRGGTSVVAPSDARRARVIFRRYSTGTGAAVFGGMLMKRRSNANLIVEGAVTTDKLAANSIVASKIAANTITANEIAALAITTGKIAADAVTATQIAANAVTAEQVLANAISAAKIAANAVTATQLAANSVTATSIAVNTIVAANIAANAITTNELAANAVTATNILANAITTAKIATNAVTANEIAGNTITAGQIAANSITGAKIAANTITANEIASNTITAKQLIIGDFTNLIPDATMNDITSWSPSGTNRPYFITHTLGAGGKAIRIAGGTAADGTTLGVIYSDYFPVQPGLEYVVGVNVDPSSTTEGASPGSGNCRIYWYTADKVASVNSSYNTFANKAVSDNSDTRYDTIQTAPADACFARIRTARYTSAANTDTALAGNVNFHSYVCRKATSGEMIVSGAITAAKIAANSITSGQVAANAITGNELAANSVAAAAIVANAITSAKIAANAITAVQLAANSVTATSISVANLAAISSNLGAITGGSLSINNNFIVSSSGAVTIRNATTGQRLLITNSLIRVYDAANVERVRLGIW